MGLWEIVVVTFNEGGNRGTCSKRQFHISMIHSKCMAVYKNLDFLSQMLDCKFRNINKPKITGKAMQKSDKSIDHNSWKVNINKGNAKRGVSPRQRSCQGI